MNAHDRPILSLVSGPGQFIIPKFQRPFRWNDEQCLTLLDDVAEAAVEASGERHFLGSIVHFPRVKEFGFTKSLLIDGQQRLTTLTLLLCTLRELSEDNPQRRGQLEDSLINRNRTGSERYKLILRDADQEALQHIVDHGSPRDGDTGAVAHRYRTLREAVLNRDHEQVLRGLDHTCHVDVVLEAQDNHQAIFESLNAKFEPLSLLDKVRNFALMGLDDDEMTRVWDDSWRGIEDRYGGPDDDRRKAAAFGLLARDLLALAGTRERRRNEDPYARIRRWATRWKTNTTPGRVRFVSDLAEQAERHAAFTLEVAVPAGLEEPLAKCSRLSDTPGPVVLRLLGALGDTLSVADVQEALHTIESVLVRRRCCGLLTGGEREAFARIGRTLNPRCTTEDIDQAFSRVFRGSRRTPSDAEFTEALVHRAMPRRGPLVQHVLEGLENDASKEKVATEGLTIEHVLPQTRNLPDDWQNLLGTDWKEAHERCVQRLGNLTLTAYNPELGARPLREKQEIRGGYRESKAVWLNSDLKDVATWNEASIEARGGRMSERAILLWPQLSLVEDGLEDNLELDPGAGGPILTASDRQKAWRKRGAANWEVEENGVRVQQAVAAALLQMDRRGPDIASRSHPLVSQKGGRLYVAIAHGVEGFIYRALNQDNRRVWLEEFADEIERQDGPPPTIGSAAIAGDIDVWLPTSPDPGTAYPLTEKTRMVIDANVDRSQTLRLNDSGATLQASSGSRRAWRTEDGPWQVFGNATATLASLARWLANQDHRGPAAFYAACPWHFSRGAAEYVGRAVLVDLEHDIKLRYEYLGTYPACRDFAWRMCQQVETKTGRSVTLGTDVELWMPDSALQEAPK